MHTVRTFLTLAALALSALLATGSALAAQPTQGGTLVVGLSQSPRSLNGAIQSGMATALPSTQLFAGLLRYDADGNPQPYLATSWEWSDDHLSFTVHLRHDAVFHDGQPITSKDVAFSIRINKENHPFKSMFAAVDQVDTPDPYTAIFRLSHPHPALLKALSPALAPILPEHVYGKGDIKTNPHNMKDVVGSGPFKLKEFVPGKKIVLQRFDRFFLKGKPYLDRIVVRISQAPTTMLIGLERNEIQMVPFMVDTSLIKRALGDQNLKVYKKGYGAIGAIGLFTFNTAKKPFDDRRVRQAIDYAIDKDFIVNVLDGGFATRNYGPIAGSSPLASPDACHKYPLDLDKARALLDEAGYPPDADGVRFSMSIDMIPGSDLSKAAAQYVRTQLKKVGIDARLHSSPDFPSWVSRIAGHQFDMTTNSLWNWGDPVIGVERTYLTSNIRPVIFANNSSYSNEKVDQLLHEAAREMDPVQRKKLYAQFEQIVTDDVPVIFIGQTGFRTIARENVGNVVTSIWGSLSPMDNLYLK